VITSRKELQTYINTPENGLIKFEEVNKINLSLTYIPSKLLEAAKRPEVKKEGLGQGDQPDERIYFLLGLSANKKELLKQLGYNKYSELVQVLSFRMNEFIELIPGQDHSIVPEICQFQQTYGLAKENNLLIVFKADKLPASKTYIVKIREFGLGVGDVGFKFNIDDITNLPTLKF
jgi:hypothetical protein